MAKTRLISTNLLRMFDRIATPVYLIEANSEISYANKACLDWVQVSAEELNGAVCRYTSHVLEGSVENRIRGLAPPPDFLDQEVSKFESRTCSVFTDSHDGEKQFRDAQIFRMIDATGGAAGVWVVCDHASRASRTPNSSKPVDSPEGIHELLAGLREQFQRKYSLQSVVGLDSSTLALRKKIDVAVSSTADILISGPSGSGREHMARVIDLERRPGSPPPIPLHCELADQELIQKHIKELSRDLRAPGHLKESPAKCLLLLDIDQLSEVGQAELWGFVKLLEPSFQIISTSGHSLVELSRQQNFHAGLAHYLSTLHLELLPLNKRAGDLPILAQSFLEEANTDRSKQLAGFSTAAMQLIQRFNWPRNIDQLQADILAAAKTARGNVVDLDDLPENLRLASRALEMGRAADSRIQLDVYLKEIECELIARAMKQAKGNKTQASKLLGISRPKLLRRLQLLSVAEVEDAARDDPQLVDSSIFKEAGEDE